MGSQSYGSDANSASRNWGPNCYCGRATSIIKSWTNDNPGRRFIRCGVHGFVNWADEDKPYGWQKVSLLEARDEIRQLKDEMKVFKESVQATNEQGLTDMNSVLVNKDEQEKYQLENEVKACNEREKLLRQFIVLSWGSFILVIAMILAMGKK
ncbi:hypothetical protein CARUB_v10027303mg [Capsella rubella]|uniref:DUF7900 domain-containing protein n=1 Tax=Capsella rubella TaxID=81985 RepID=R0EY02_9BRAS|nr:uncharacterized protein At4g04775 [Capsella rubella]EOA14157.1 hypothetical protein CARUB_v10027303mg [Capsella rubella]